jgi:integrase
MDASRSSDFVFPGQSGGAMSTSALPQFLRVIGRTDFTTHGFRSAFRDWAGESTAYPREVVEMALAHRIGNATEQAYARGDLFQKRRQLMAAWGRYCTAPVIEGAVVAIGDRRGVRRH